MTVAVKCFKCRSIRRLELRNGSLVILFDLLFFFIDKCRQHLCMSLIQYWFWCNIFIQYLVFFYYFLFSFYFDLNEIDCFLMQY